MRLEIDMPEHHYNNIMAFDSVSLGRVPYKGIIMYAINAIKHGKVLDQEPTNKNDLPHCQCTDAEIAKSFIEDVEAVKNQLPTTKNDLGVEGDLVSSIVEKISEKATETREEFIFETIRPYCENVVQMKISKRDLEQALLKYYGKNLGGDCISRAEAVRVASGYCHPSNIAKELAKLPSTPQEPKIVPIAEIKYDEDKLKELVNKAVLTVTPQEPKWIPVSERLPDTDNEVLCWYEYYHWSQGKVLPEYGLGRYLRETSAWFGEVANGKDVRVIAWMPLPTPYEPQGSEE